MQKCPTRSRNLKIISRSWNINPRVATWAVEHRSMCEGETVRDIWDHAAQSWKKHISLVPHEGNRIRCRPFHSFSEFPLWKLSPNGQHYRTVLCCCWLASNMDEKAFVKLLLVRQSLHMSVCAFLGRYTARGYFKGPYHKKGFAFCFWNSNSQHKANPPSPFRIKALENERVKLKIAFINR